MSETRIVVGMMARLKTPLKYSEVSEDFCDRKDGLEINYEGTLVYLSTFDEPAYNFSIQVGLPIPAIELEKICESAGYPVFNDSVRPFFVNWYDSSDSPLSVLTLEQFFELGWSA